MNRMQELTKMQELLIELLQAFGVRKDIIVAVLLMVNTDDQIMELTEFMDRNRQATEDEIIEEAVRISEMEE